MKFKTIPFRQVTKHLSSDETPLFDKGTVSTFIGLVDTLDYPYYGKELRKHLDTCEVVLIDEGRGYEPFLSDSSWLSSKSAYGADWVLQPYPRCTLEQFHARMVAYMKWSGDVIGNLPNLAMNVSPSDIGMRMDLYGFDLTRPISSLNSKRRNEVKKASQVHGNKNIVSLEGVDLNVFQLMHDKWIGNEDTNVPHSFLDWTWAFACQQCGCGRVLAITEDDTPVFYAGFGLVSPDSLQFLTFVQRNEQNYSGTYTLAKSIEYMQSHPLPGVTNLLLTCSSAALDTTFELYKRTLSNFVWSSPSLFYIREADEENPPFPPYFDVSRNKWVQDE